MTEARTHKDAAVDFLSMVAAGQVRAAFERHVAAGFRHHNPYFRGDGAALMAAMQDNAAKNPDKVLEVRTVLQEGDQVAVFSRVRQQPADRGGAVVHLFRFEGDRIAEFWDVGQAVPDPCVNENGMF